LPMFAFFTITRVVCNWQLPRASPCLCMIKKVVHVSVCRWGQRPAGAQLKRASINVAILNVTS
jgi:hypothetical protein